MTDGPEVEKDAEKPRAVRVTLGGAFMLAAAYYAGKLDDFLYRHSRKGRARRAETQRMNAEDRRTVETVLLPRLTGEARRLTGEILKTHKDPLVFLSILAAADTRLFSSADPRREGEKTIVLRPDGAVEVNGAVTSDAESMAFEACIFVYKNNGFFDEKDKQEARLEDAKLMAAWIGHAVRDVPLLLGDYDAGLDAEGRVVLAEAPFEEGIVGTHEEQRERWRRRWSAVSLSAPVLQAPQP